ncbi:MAG TPA: TonB-dependent siderophore receptor [Thermoanaerobaculia bacterium]
MSGRRAKTLRRKFAVGALVACSTFGTRTVDAQTPPSTSAANRTGTTVAALPLRRFEIPAGTLDAAIRAYESATGVRVRVNFDREVLANLNTNGVSGMMTNAEALTRLLENSGVESRFTNGLNAVLTLPMLSESIEVGAATPEVSSPKMTRPILETPRTINVIAEETILAQGATTLRDVLRNTPGITFQAGEGGGGVPGDTFSMRGFSTGNDITLDGLRESGAYSRDAFNIEQVEVVKGPAGAMAGRGATGGSINIVSKSAKLESFSRATVAAGTADHQRASLDTNVPIEAIGGAFRFNAMMTEGGVPGRDVVRNESWGVAPTISFGIGKPSRFTLAYQHLAQNNVPDYGLPWAAFDTTPRADQSNFYGLEHYDYEDVNADAATATFEHDLRDGITFRNVSRWADNHRDSAITAPRPPNRQLQQRLMDNGQLANATTLSAKIGAHSAVFGVEAARETTYIRRQAQTTNQPQTNLGNPDPTQNPLGPMPLNIGNPEDTNLDLLGVYAFDTMQLGAKWEVSAGLRWDTVDVDYSLTNVATSAITKLGRKDDMLSWNGGVVFKPRTNMSFYASAATSFNPSVDAAASGAGLSDVPTSANNVNLEPEKTRNLEVGAKWETLGGKAIATAALFSTNKTNARTRNATTEPFVLDGEQQVDGVELGITGKITENWSVLAGYAFLDSEFVASRNAAEQGAELAMVPEHSLNLWTDARLTPRVTIGGGAQYMDSVFRNATNTAEVPSYWLLSAMASYSVNPSLTLRLNVNNLADETYVDRVGGGHYVPGPGRSIVLNAEIDF